MIAEGVSKKKALILLERECAFARELGLVEEFVYNPFLEQPYMYIRFHTYTRAEMIESVSSYISSNFAVKSVVSVEDGRALYVEYDFWDRQP